MQIKCVDDLFSAPAKVMKPAAPVDVSALAEGVRKGQRRALAKAITLVESSRADHQESAAVLLDLLTPHRGNTLRIGITGVPGVGKSTFIEALGLHLIAAGNKVAVLAVDPSSSLTGGSILGDKTRMEQLAHRAEAFIRPTPTAGALGGVAEKTREAMLIVEAAGFNIVIVETVGVGQSETLVAGMTDCFALLLLPNAGDDLQAIKKGIMELADIIVFNKSDLDARASTQASAQMRAALGLLRPTSMFWKPPVLSLSALANADTTLGVAQFWQQVEKFRSTLIQSGEWEARRKRQAGDWMWQMIDSGLRCRFRTHPDVAAALPEIVAAVESGKTSPAAAAQNLLRMMHQ